VHRLFDRLRLWRDSNHDGVSQSDEILTLSEARVERISLAFTESDRRDRHGNLFKYRSFVQFSTARGNSIYRLALNPWQRW
jgi:hypothetical protein